MFLSVFGHYVDAANIQNIFTVNKSFAIYFGKMSIFVDICGKKEFFLLIAAEIWNVFRIFGALIASKHTNILTI